MASGKRSGWNGKMIGAVSALLAGGALTAAFPAAARSAPAPKLFAERWIDGTQGPEPLTQVQALDADSFVIRQSIATNFEAPFVYLLFGRDKAFLFDTGAEDGHIRPAVDRLVAAWLAAHKRTSIPLVVAHSHSHGDHVAGDTAFRARPDTTVVGLKPADVAGFFAIADWPDAIGRFDLGGRILEIVPTPGHQAAAIMVYDARLKVLLSGDTLYPGRLYIPVNFLNTNRASIDRLAAFSARRPIRAALGAHIEMTQTPGKDYGQRAPTHPDEHRLEMPVSAIDELRSGLKAKLDTPNQRQIHDDFIIAPVGPRPE